MKIGDGVLAWNDLLYFVFDTINISIEFIMDAGDADLTAGEKGDMELPFDCTIQSVKLLAESPGDAVIDIRKTNYATFPTSTSITGSALPTLTASQKSFDNTLTGWTIDFVKGDILRFSVISASGIQRLTISLIVLKK